MHVTGKLIRFLLETAENVHKVADDAGRVAVTDAGQITRRLRSTPLVRLCVKAEENIATCQESKKLRQPFC